MDCIYQICKLVQIASGGVKTQIRAIAHFALCRNSSRRNVQHRVVQPQSAPRLVVSDVNNALNRQASRRVSDALRFAAGSAQLEIGTHSNAFEASRPRPFGATIYESGEVDPLQIFSVRRSLRRMQ